MQARGNASPVGTIFDTSLNRSEHVLAMAVLYKLQSAREARVASLSVSLPDLRAAALCDALARYLSGSGTRNVAPVGLSERRMQALAATPMADAVLGEHTSTGEPRYPQGIKKRNDTADAAAMIRNGISAQQPENAVVVAVGPLSNIAEAMALPDVLDLVPKRVRALVIAATAEDLRSDLASARKVLANWASPVVFVEAPGLVFPGAQLEPHFAWAMSHPVREAYKAFQTMPYDAPLQSAVAVLFAGRPASDLFTLSAGGAIEVMDNGSVRFQASAAGTRKMLRIAANQQDAAVQTLVELITSQPPAAPAGRGGRGGPPPQ
ncbi:MAG: hypothetical protein ABI824_14875 [Acidobacteriota bacterium]